MGCGVHSGIGTASTNDENDCFESNCDDNDKDTDMSVSSKILRSDMLCSDIHKHNINKPFFVIVHLSILLQCHKVRYTLYTIICYLASYHKINQDVNDQHYKSQQK